MYILFLMSQIGETFFTTLGCMDGRVQAPVTKFGQDRFHASYPDTITEAGLVGVLSKEDASSDLMDSIKRKLLISLEKHKSSGILVHGHQMCAGNPVDDKTHRRDVLEAVERVKRMVPENTKVLGLFVIRKDNSWVSEEL